MLAECFQSILMQHKPLNLIADARLSFGLSHYVKQRILAVIQAAGLANYYPNGGHSHQKANTKYFVPFHCHGININERDRAELRSLLPRARHICAGKMRAPGVLSLLHQDEGSVRPKVLRRVPRRARQGTARLALLPRGWNVTVQAASASQLARQLVIVSKPRFN